ncbi:MAG: hypothetical protein ACK5C4_18710 [Pseudanabaena sp.]|jgi:hypothetical protein
MKKYQTSNKSPRNKSFFILLLEILFYGKFPDEIDRLSSLLFYLSYKQLKLKVYRDEMLEERVRGIIKDCDERSWKKRDGEIVRREQLQHIIYANQRSLHKFHAITSIGCFLYFVILTFAVVTFSILVSGFLYFLINFCIAVFTIIFTFPIVLLLILFRFHFLEYLDKNNCYIVTRDYLYYISKEFDVYTIVNYFTRRGNKASLNFKMFEIKNIYQVAFDTPPIYQMCNMDHCGIVRMYIQDADYVQEVERQEEIKKQNSSNNNYQTNKTAIQRFPTEFGAKAALFEIHGVEHPVQVVKNINDYAKFMRGENLG